MNDQVFTLDPSDAYLFYDIVSTDATGAINEWQFFAETEPGGLATIYTAGELPLGSDEISGYGEPQATGSGYSEVYAPDPLGTWAETGVASTPEPSLLVPLGGAILLIAMVRKHKSPLGAVHR
jgi:hypothetical protein